LQWWRFPYIHNLLTQSENWSELNGFMPTNPFTMPHLVAEKLAEVRSPSVAKSSMSSAEVRNAPEAAAIASRAAAANLWCTDPVSRIEDNPDNDAFSGHWPCAFQLIR
jgi:hypothetical protein